jgi:hypothetical protein
MLKISQKDKDTVRTMSAYGVPQKQIAAAICVSLGSLHKYFKDELDGGQAEVSLKIAQTLYQKAIEGNVTALIFWLKCRMRWNENPIEEEIKTAVAEMTDEELTQIINDHKRKRSSNGAAKA